MHGLFQGSYIHAVGFRQVLLANKGPRAPVTGQIVTKCCVAITLGSHEGQEVVLQGC